MEPRNMAIGGIFNDSKRLVVPIYQRTFEWTPERQIETLMDYIEAKAEARLANEPARFLHYMGALLLIPRSGFVFGRIPIFDIVDGQQRITTFQLALAALRDLANERGEQSIADQIRPLLFNLDEASMQDKKAERFKLEPTRLDRPIFRDLMTKSLAELQEAYATFFTQAGNLRKTSVPSAKAAGRLVVHPPARSRVPRGSERAGHAATRAARSDATGLAPYRYYDRGIRRRPSHL